MFDLGSVGASHRRLRNIPTPGTLAARAAPTKDSPRRHDQADRDP
jgi:hypothetical protein